MNEDSMAEKTPFELLRVVFKKEGNHPLEIILIYPTIKGNIVNLWMSLLTKNVKKGW